MKLVVVKPWKIVAAGALCALLLAGSVLGALAAWDLLRPREAKAYGEEGVGSLSWFFAEGYTGPGFEEWILVFNPPKDIGGSGRVAMVWLLFYGPSGEIGAQYLQLEPGQRGSVNVGEVLKKEYNYEGDVSVAVISWSNMAPVICERAMYYNHRGQITGGSQVPGYAEAEYGWHPWLEQGGE